MRWFQRKNRRRIAIVLALIGTPGGLHGQQLGGPITQMPIALALQTPDGQSAIPQEEGPKAGPTPNSSDKSAEANSEVAVESNQPAKPEQAAAAATSEKPAEPQKPYVVGSSLELSSKVNNGGLQFETSNKDYRYHVGALIQQDYAFFSQDQELKVPPSAGQGPPGGIGELQDAVFFRRGRIRFDGIAHDVIEWDFDCELLANNTVAFDDLWVGTTNLPIVGNVRAGHVKIPMGIESITSNRVFTFVERASMFDAFLPEYGPGILAFDSYNDAKLTWAACASS